MSRIVRRINEQPQTVGIGIVGKIAIGEKNEKGFPTSLDYFKCRSDNPDYVAMFTAKYGNKPTHLTITFLSNDMSECCSQFYELRDGAGKRVAYGDGQKFHVATKQGDNLVRDVEMMPESPDKWMQEIAKSTGKEWKEVLVLRFALPEMPLLGVWEFRTSGDDSTIPQILKTVDTVYQMAGRIMTIPFDLSVKKVKSDKAGSKSNYPVVSLVCNISTETIDKIKQLPGGIYKMLTEQTVLQLSGGSDQPMAKVYSEAPEQFTEFEELPSESTGIPAKTYAECFAEAFTLSDKESYTAAAVTIAAMTDLKARSEYVAILSAKAQQCGYQWDRKKSRYI